MPFKLFEFHHPWMFLLVIPALAILYWRSRSQKGTAAIVFPSVARLKGLRPTLRQRARLLIPLLQAVAICGFVIAAARPRQGDARTVIRSQGIAIQMVLDRSGSMEETMLYDGHRRKRIDIVKDVFMKFVAGGDALAGRKTDLIGLTTFARFTEESCPLVSQHEPLITAVKNLGTVAPALDEFDQPVRNVKEAQRRRIKLKQNPLNATAIGDGIYRAVLSLVAAEEDLKAEESEADDGGAQALTGDQSDYEITGKVIILLTDGENNTGMDPVEAGRYAANNEIRLYYIVFREPLEYQQTLFGQRVKRELSPDEILEVPRKVVESTEGRAFLAASGDELRQIYEEIDSLEKSEIGKIEFRSYHEKYHWFLIPAFACAVIAVFLAETLFRRIP